MDLVTLLNIGDDIGWFVAPVAGYLLAAGDRGATAEELSELIGDQSEVNDALAMLRSYGVIVQGEGPKPMIRLQAKGYDSHERIHARLPFRIASIPESLQSGKPLKKTGELETSPNAKKIKTRKLRPQKPKRKGRFADKPSSVRLVKVRKIRTKGIGALQDMVANDTARTYRNCGGGPRYIDEPSRYPILNLWPGMDNANHWKGLDWIGYWLHHWLHHYGQEDPVFAGQRCHGVTSKPDIYMEHGFMAVRLRDSDRGFRGDGEGLREYLDWLFSDFIPEAEWLTSPVSAGQIFRIRNNLFLDRFRSRSVRVNSKSKRPRGKWNPWGYNRRG